MAAQTLAATIDSAYAASIATVPADPEAIADLFTGPEDIHHVVEMLKLREVYRHLSNAADRGDEAGNIIADIVVKKT